MHLMSMRQEVPKRTDKDDPTRFRQFRFDITGRTFQNPSGKGTSENDMVPSWRDEICCKTVEVNAFSQVSDEFRVM